MCTPVGTALRVTACVYVRMSACVRYERAYVSPCLKARTHVIIFIISKGYENKRSLPAKIFTGYLFRVHLQREYFVNAVLILICLLCYNLQIQ